ncbi:MAG: hypothetical protein AB7P03_13415 [Kofleriaceae bacterium]
MSPTRRLALVIAVLAVSCTGTVCAVAQGAEGDPIAPLRCQQAAEDAGLSDAEAIRLCLGASSDAPAQCFAQATDEADLSSFNAVRLCRMARSTTPALCALRLGDTTALDANERVSYCAALEGPLAVPPGSGSPECLEQALAAPALSDRQAAQLCRGSTSTAPLLCYEWGDANTALSTSDLVELCAPRAVWAPLRR